MHGGDVYTFTEEQGIEQESVLDFSANMNDFINVKNMKIYGKDIKNYPENNLEHYKSILSENKFKNGNIAIVPGLTSFIHFYMAGLKGNAIIISPAFTEYDYARTDASRIKLPFNALNRNPEIIEYYNFDSLFLVYPDNPTGQIMSKDSLIKILDICLRKNADVFLDESFIWFVNKREVDEAELIEAYHNLVIGRSLTKILSIPGLRLAYILSSCENICRIENNLDPWRISQPALLYLRSCGMDFSGIPEKTERERKYMIKSLKKIGLEPVGSPRANFVTFRLPGRINGMEMKKFLATRNIMIRILDDYPEFGGDYMRIGIKKRGKNVILLRSIMEYIGGLND
ncbi:MAG: aminotransferase class I/II-fold pyridoxal phosphate-dependent enzyme [Candidatus Thermoplasmatota archaeon]|nr:aminotransferase class I/II-fold pyridoxal phosphate-dependent enzyme [Candidatus Thermoplasmatota archaeon]